jgi:hypothetical protein
MTAAIWFGLAAIALVGAIALLYFDRLQRQRTGHVRQVWAKAQGYTYVSVEPSLAATWHRGAMAKLGYLTAVDVVSGNRKGEKFVLFDLEDAATLVAVRRQIGSDIDIDLRLKTAAPPKDADLELLGAIGDRVVFATNPDIARHAVDQRMVAFIETLPMPVAQLWSEGNWTLGMLPVGTAARDWEAVIDAVLRLSGLLHVLPPVAGGERRRPVEVVEHDPGRPRPPASVILDSGEDDYDDGYLGDESYSGEHDPDDASYDEEFDSDEHDDSRAERFGPDEPYDADERYRSDEHHRPGRQYSAPARHPVGERFDDHDEPAYPEPFLDDRPGRADGSEVFGPAVSDPVMSGSVTSGPVAPGPAGYGAPADLSVGDTGDHHIPLVEDIAGETELDPRRRPQLAVVPDPRTRVRRNWPPAEEEFDDAAGPTARDVEEDGARRADDEPEQAGGPFHPGFRPYQGPAPR